MAALMKAGCSTTVKTGRGKTAALLVAGSGNLSAVEWFRVQDRSRKVAALLVQAEQMMAATEFEKAKAVLKKALLLVEPSQSQLSSLYRSAGVWDAPVDDATRVVAAVFWGNLPSECR